jgi:hypothetical protein
METTTNLRRNRNDGNTSVETTITIVPKLDAPVYHVESTSLIKRVSSGALLETKVTTWTVDDGADRQRLLDTLVQRGFTIS